MENRIRDYIESVFRDVPKSERAENIKSEILSNLLDKYHDLKNSGKTDEEAYAMAISSGGDLSGTVSDLKGEKVKYSYAYEKQFERMYEKQYKREKKKCKAFSSFLWPIVVCAYLLYSFLVDGAWAYSWIIFIAASAVDCLYAAIVIKSNDGKKNSAIGGAVWTGITAAYFIVSFATMRWDVSWILFVLGVPLANLVRVIANKKEYDDGDDGDDDDEEK